MVRTPGVPVAWVTPTYDLGRIAWHEFEDRFYPAIDQKRTNKNEHLITLHNGSRLYFRSATNPVSIRGRGYVLMLVDEGEWIQKQTFEGSMLPTLADMNGDLVVFTTPRGRRGWVYEEFQRSVHKEPGYAHLQRSSMDNVRVRAYIEFRKNKMSPLAFRQEFGAEFTEDEGDPFANWENCIAGELEEAQPGVKYFGGIDLAKYRDWTVVIILRREGGTVRIVALERFHRMDWPEQVARLKRYTEAYNPYLIADQGEVGDAVISMMRTAGMNVDGLRITDSTQGRTRPKTKADKKAHGAGTIGRTPLMEHLAAEVSWGRVQCPVVLDRGVLGEEMRSFMVDLDSRGRTHYETRGEFDDCVFALALGLQAVPQYTDVKMRVATDARGPDILEEEF